MGLKEQAIGAFEQELAKQLADAERKAVERRKELNILLKVRIKGAFNLNVFPVDNQVKIDDLYFSLIDKGETTELAVACPCAVCGNPSPFLGNFENLVDLGKHLKSKPSDLKCITHLYQPGNARGGSNNW